jgi:DUF4097 and DUF4098 domain-containing protein YvlB
MLRMICVTATIAIGLAAAGLTQAQSRNQGFGRSPDAWCDDTGNRNRASHCEVRDETIGGANPLDVDAGHNGGIRVRGWDRGDVLVRSRIVGTADSDAEARRIVSGVRIETAGGRVRVDGPETADAHWSVSFEIQVPRNGQLTLKTHNGGIAIEDFSGTAQFRGQNGGVSLTNVGGDIRGATTNGGLDINLGGDRWDGAGLDVETQNGGVRIAMPEQYSAELEAATTNGGVSIDFPVTVQGMIGRHLTTTLGAGGARIRAITTNGGVSIHRR